MWSKAREIADGDTIIVWMTREQLLPVVIQTGQELNGRFGYYRHQDLIGVPYGSKVPSRNGRGFVHVLRPTPELWTRALPHRTQILYLADIAFVTAWLNIRPGSIVVEAGTGSGSFSHATARTVGSTGQLYSYEFHEGRAAKAKEDFERHGMKNITLTHRNVCRDGFTINDTADAVFLDLPAPWEAVEHAKKALKKDRVSRICCFSPCMEQVLRTVNALNAAGFSDVTMYESLIRPHEVSAVTPLLSVTDAAARLKSQEARREQKRLHQITASRARVQGKSADGDGKRKRDELEAEDAEDGEQESVDVVEAKKPKIEADVADAQPSRSGLPVRASEQTSTANNKGKGRWKPIPMGEPRFVVSKAFPEVRGHTSYLTFALLAPLPATTQSLDTDSAQPSASIASVETPVIPVADVDVMNGHISDDISRTSV